MAPPIDPIDPQQIGESAERFHLAQNPFFYELLAQKAQRTGVSSQQDPATPGINEVAPLYDDPDTPDVDEARMASDQEYLKDRMSWIHWRARYYFRNGWYDAAEQLYVRFFRYMHFYGNRILDRYSGTYTGYSGNTIDYYNAMFERRWLMDNIGKQKEGERFLNEQLMRKLEWAMSEKNHNEEQRLHAAELKVIINGYFQRGELPNPKDAQALFRPVPLAVLGNVMQQLVNAGQPMLAHHVLAHIEVRQMISLFQTEREAQRLFPQQQQGLVSPLLQAMFTQQAAMHGVPMAPSLPMTADERQRLHPDYKKLADIDHVYTDLVEPVYGLGKDPNEAVKLRKQQEKAAQLRKAKNKKLIPPPDKADEFDDGDAEGSDD